MKKSKLPILIIISIFFLILFLVILIIIIYNNNLKPISNESKEIKIIIEDGFTNSKIGEILENNKIIKSKNAFNYYLKKNKISNLKAGEYTLNQNMNIQEIVKILQTGSNNTINIVIPEGKNIKSFAKLLSQKTNITENQVYDKLKNSTYIDSLINKYWFLTNNIKNEKIYYPLEGYLFPDTYNFEKDTNVEDVFEKLLDQMGLKLEKYKGIIEQKNISVHDILTIASIIEVEGNDEESRKNISSVIYNRLKANMAIGSDATTYYGLKLDMTERNLTTKEINTYNAYNTRGPDMNGKLPVGPIALVGEESINAALYPNDTKYLYFVSDKNGKIYFSETSDEHDKTIANLKQQGLWYTYN